ncbi:MAG: hypothetical protein IJH95_06740 [Mogibacterium sp.]|nr:hypothetical protein [Mogibacterium sp.]
MRSEGTVNGLIRNITEGARAAHAFILEGRAGDARDSFIKSLASGLECTADDPLTRPCGCCPSCRQIAAGSCMDIVRMAKTVSKSGNASYRTEDAADFTERLGMGAYGRFLIGIIDDADSMSEVVQNKLLKTLEEPADSTLLILAAANRDALLETVRSRCSIIRLSEYTDPDEDEIRSAAAIEETAELFMKADCRFYEFRAAVDKHIKSKTDAFGLLDEIEDAAAARMKDGRSPAGMAELIGLAETVRSDMMREMNYGRALRRLFLESR